MYRFRCLALLLLCCVSCTLFADDSARVTNLNQHISSIKLDLAKAQNKREHIEYTLKSAEISLAKMSMSLSKTSGQLQIQQSKLNSLNQQTSQYEQRLKSTQQLLYQQLKTAYILGREPYLKLLLSPNRVSQINRTLIYYQYLSRAQASIAQKISSDLRFLKQNQTKIANKTVELKTLQKKQQVERNAVQHAKGERERIIDQLSYHIHQQRAELTRSKQLLEKKVHQLELENTESYNLPEQNLAKLKGKLFWPTRGQVLNYFGTQIDNSELRWSGILIKAKESEPVRAIANGKVVFADWMPGYGLLVIVNHGYGFMTLYGRNQNLYKRVGDTVHKGELIATVGKSGGYQTPALYFAIRYNAKPLNPSIWCSHTA
jgi:septal ring factor EnvC (AmiA/AmiB activator)